MIRVLCCIWAAMILTHSFYSPFHRKCKLTTSGNDLGSLQISRAPRYDAGFGFPEQDNHTLQIEYKDFDFLYMEYIGAGGSGEVYLVEDEHTGKPMILKRFFKENKLEFNEQNYIMNKMGYYVGWHHEDNNPKKPTLASYVQKESVTLRDVELESSEQFALVLYKICKQLQVAHKQGIIHNDVKMGNILVSSVGTNLKSIQVQLIDWNLASFYYPGYQSSMKHGTNCYYSPELLMRTTYLTPATDIWSLGVVYFTFMTDKKPFHINCKDSNLEAIISLVGAKKFFQFLEKYRLYSSIEFKLIQKVKKHPEKYQGTSIRDRIPTNMAEYFNDHLVDLFEKMLEVDPEHRITITEILNHPYFDKIKRLPPMYEMKDKQSEKAPEPRKAPADNLVPAEPPSI